LSNAECDPRLAGISPYLATKEGLFHRGSGLPWLSGKGLSFGSSSRRKVNVSSRVANWEVATKGS